eukprot:365540-Chlamydomonas_euryale.AAC.3
MQLDRWLDWLIDGSMDGVLAPTLPAQSLRVSRIRCASAGCCSAAGGSACMHGTSSRLGLQANLDARTKPGKGVDKGVEHCQGVCAEGAMVGCVLV